MISLVLAATILAAVPPDLDQFEKVFVPALTTPGTVITGVNGSVFSSAVFGISATPVRVWTGNDVETVQAARAFAFPGTSRGGRILYVERTNASAISLNAVLSSSAAGGVGWYDAMLPVVRESDVRTETTAILGVSSRYIYVTGEDGISRSAIEQTRHHLRVYDVDARGNAQVRVRRYDQSVGGSVLLGELVLTLDRREGDDPTYPSFAEILIPELCHPFSRHTPCAGGSQWIEIAPLTPGLRFFPIVSATDNVTQQVALTWPQ
jgi:hypothetical protein